MKLPTEADGRDDWKNRTKTDNGACRQGAKSQPEVDNANRGELDLYNHRRKKEYRSSNLATSKETSEELSVQVEQLPEKAEVCTVLQHVQQGKLIRETSFYPRNLLLEEGNKCFELYKSNGFVHEQQFALQDDWDEIPMFRKLCHSAMKHDFKVSLVEETIVSDSNISNHWTGNGNSGLDAVAQA